MTNGEYHEGEIVAISSSYVLFRVNSSIQSLPREQIKYVFSNRPAPVIVSAPVVSLAAPISKKFVGELEGALTMFNPFALKMGFTEWMKLNEKGWSVGLGTSFQFFRFGMLNVSTHLRKYSKGKYFKTFAEGEAAISFYETMIGFQPLNYDFRPVKQLGLYGGLWLDTGYDIAFTIKAGLSGTWYKLVEDYTPTYRVEGTYYKGSPVFSWSVVF